MVNRIIPYQSLTVSIFYSFGRSYPQPSAFSFCFLKVVVVNEYIIINDRESTHRFEPDSASVSASNMLADSLHSDKILINNIALAYTRH
jgi:hypothetical protein